MSLHRSLGAALGFVLIGVLAAACAAGRDAESPEPGSACGGDMPWGGWKGSPECKAIAETMIGAEDLSCEQDEDCVLVGATSCSANSVARAAQSRWARQPPGCGPPNADQCPPIAFRPRCVGGCCNVGVGP